jgi:outer membrane protein OmpA-like peptidoglycan-associated protein/tetratricopeptide (TPR) repeat protein
MKTHYTILISLITVILLFVGNVMLAQPTHAKAEQLMEKYEFAKAAEWYEAYFLSHSPTDTELRNISYCYMQINETAKAEKWLSKLVIKESATAEDMKIYALLLKSEAKYDEAMVIFEKLSSRFPDLKSFSNDQIIQCKLAQTWIATPEFFDIKNVETFNSKNSEFGLIKVKDEYFLTSDRKIENNTSEEYGWTGNPFLKMYKIEMNGENVKSIDPISDLNFAYHNGPGIFDEKTSTIWFTRTKSVKQKQKPTNPDPTSWFSGKIQDVYTNRLEIYSAKLVDGKWTEITAFTHNNAELFSVGHPAISPDGNVLYFVSDMQGGFGETDIYYCEKRSNGSWSDPRNVGPQINSIGKEMFPVVDKDGTLYFSSDGHHGMGGLDLFKSTGSKKDWSLPENLKFPLNSSRDDFSILFTESGTKGFLASNRYGGLGGDDIYSFEYSPPPPPVPTELILALTTWERLDDGKLIPAEGIKVHYHIVGSNVENSIEMGYPGMYQTVLDCDAKYQIHGYSDSFFAQSVEIETKCETMNDTIHAQLIFERIVVNKPIVIENIYYDYDKWNIRPDAAIELDKIVVLLTDNPTIIIELGSHTDSRGSDKYNESLSQKRAESAVQYIVDSGIAFDRITAKGYGEYKLVNKCSNGVKCSEEEHQMNRRTEFKVTGFSKDQPVIYSAGE